MAAGLKQFLDINHLDEVHQTLKKYGYSGTSYYQLGLSLGLSARTLDAIEAENRENVSRSLLEVLKKWLKQFDAVESKGGPSYYTLIVALKAIGENAVANGIDREKYPAWTIIVNHQHQLSQSLNDDLVPSLVRLLHKEGVISQEIHTSTVSGNKHDLLMTVQEAVRINYNNLKKFAVVLQQFTATVSVSKAILDDYKKEFPDHDANSSNDITAGDTKHETCGPPDIDLLSGQSNEVSMANEDEETASSHSSLEEKPSDDTNKVRPPKNIDELLRSVGVVIYRDDDSASSGQHETDYRYIPFSCKSLKELISDPFIKIKVKPLLFSLSGLPRSGKSVTFTSFITHHIHGNPFLPPDMKIRPVAAEDVAHYDLIAVPDDIADDDFLITEATKEASSVIGILSSFKQMLLTEGKVPLLDPNDALQNVFEKPELNKHLQYMYQYICASLRDHGDKVVSRGQTPPLSKDKDGALYANKLKKVYPEESALVNIWDIPTNGTVHDILSALQGHLTNNHLALFLDLERDLENLHKPPEIDLADVNLMEWRPRIHYLLRMCRMSESLEAKGNRKAVCMIFAKHENDYNHDSKEFQRKVSELQEVVQSAAQHIGVSKLLDGNIETVGRKKFQNLPQRIKKMISMAPSEEIPIAWLFLRSMFHLSAKVFIHKDELKEIAKECGMDDSSLKSFGKFYTSFGSIFDLGLINPDAQYVIVKPIHFLKEVNKFFSSQHDKVPTMAYGIVSARAGRKELGKDWSAYINSLVSLNLATKVASDSIEMPNCDSTDTYYFISSCRTGSSIKDIDTTAVHLITSINTPVIFNQVTFARHLLASSQRRLVACTNRNQTIIKDTSSDTTVTLVSYGPATKLHLSKTNPELCSAVVQAYYDMAESSPVTVKYKFVKMCVTGKTTDVRDLSSAPSHNLPTNFLCRMCHNSDTDKDVLAVWNKALQLRPVDPKSKPTGLLTAWEIPEIAQKIVQHESYDISVIATVFDYPLFENEQRFDGLLDKSLVAELISCWQKDQETQSVQEIRHAFAKTLIELGKKLSKNDSLETKKYYEKLASRVDLYYIPKL